MIGGSSFGKVPHSRVLVIEERAIDMSFDGDELIAGVLPRDIPNTSRACFRTSLSRFRTAANQSESGLPSIVTAGFLVFSPFCLACFACRGREAPVATLGLARAFVDDGD